MIDQQTNAPKQMLDVKEIDFKEVIQHLKAGRRIIFIAMGIAFLLSCLYVLIRPAYYQPSALLQVNAQSSSSSNLFSNIGGSLAASTGLGGISTPANIAQVQMALMQTSYILQPVVNSLALNVKIQPKHLFLIGTYFAQHYQGNGPAPAKFGLSSYAWGGEILNLSAFNVPQDYYKDRFTLRVLDDQHYALYHHGDLILKGTLQQPASSNDGKVSIVVNQMQARPHTEFYLYRYSNVATLALLQSNLNINELQAKNASTFGGNQGTGLIQLSLRSAKPFNAVNILNSIANLATSDNSEQKNRQNQQLLNFIKHEIPIAQQNLIEAEKQLNTYQAQNGLVNLNDQAKSLLTDMTFVDGQIITAELNKAQLLQIYTPQNPMVANAESGILALNQQKQKLNQLLSNLPTKYQTAVDLMRNLKIYSMLYTELLMKSQQMEITNAGLSSDLTVLELATVPDQALPSFAFLKILMGTFLGGIIGSLIILTRQILYGGINDPYFVERELGIRTIAIVPYSEIQAKNKKLFDQGKIKSLPILTKIDNHDPAIESLRSLRTALTLMLAKKTGKCISISGIIPQIGKSFVSINLAAILAEAGKRVLLIDGDIRKGYLQQYFAKPITPGLSELLSGAGKLENAIHKTEFTNLDFIACGLHAQNPGDLLLSDNLPSLLQELENYYDLIIIDTPPMLAVSDASLFAKYCALNFIVVAAGKLQKHEIETAVKHFYSHGIQMDGNIFNFTNKNIQAASKFSYQSYYTRYYRKK